MSRNKRFQPFNQKIGRQFLSLPVLSLAVLCLCFQASAAFRSSVDIGIAGDLYFVDEASNNGQASANIFVENTMESGRIWLDVGAGGLIAEAGHTYIKAPQVYYQRGEKPFSLYIGRWRSEWSAVDEHWNLGLVQPQFTFDSSRPETQGLTGLFVDMTTQRDLRLTLFASYVYIPSQGASYELVDGRLASSNPWFLVPVQALAFSGEEFDLNYTIDTPSATSVLFRPSAGFNLKFNEKDYGLFSGLYYLYKPKNDLILPFEGNLNLTTFQGDVLVKPVVAQHHVVGIDFGWRGSFSELTASWVYEGGVELDGPLNTTFPELPDQNIYGVVAKLNRQGNNQVWLSYIHTVREETQVRGVFAANDISIFAARNRFEKALRAEWTGQFLVRQGLRTLQASLAYTYDPDADASWLSAKASWWALAGLELFSQCDLFGGPQQASGGNNFVTQFQNNDRCLVGGHYAF